MKTQYVFWLIVALMCFGSGQRPVSAQGQPPNSYLEFVRAAAQRDVAAAGAPLSDRAAAERRLAVVRKKLLEAWGGFPTTPCDLTPTKLGVLDRDGYTLERLLLQTFPGVWMTAHAYVPKTEGKHPAVLCVHGHWKEAKQAPQVQARCIGLVKHGFFVLAVDAFGAGERAVGENLGEYHGEMTAATLLPTGKPLSGIQVYENMRAVDYLQSRPEVDAEKIGITGASGGGNQTMYAGAWDTRFKAIVPVCSVGTYNSYLGAACCMCEVVPGAASWCCEGEILGLCAPRGLMIFNATKDANQFSVQEARKSIAVAQTFFDLAGQPAALQQTVFEWHHDYSKTMRERMYGWMTLKLKEEGDGSPLPDPDIKTEDPESIRCYPGDSRPDDWVTLPQFAAAEGRRLISGISPPSDSASWEIEQSKRRDALRHSSIFANNPSALTPGTPLQREPEGAASFVSEPGLTLPAAVTPFPDASAPVNKLVVVVSLDPSQAQNVERIRSQCEKEQWTVLVPQLRATGHLAPAGDQIGLAPDHNSSEWGLWVGRPLIGQWCHDVQRAIQSVPKSSDCEIALIGVGTGGPIVLATAAIDMSVTRVATVNSLVSFISDVPIQGQRLGLLAPGVLRDVGDISHIASLIAPRPLTITGGVTCGGETLDELTLKSVYSDTGKAYELTSNSGPLVIHSGELDVNQFLKLFP